MTCRSTYKCLALFFALFFPSLATASDYRELIKQSGVRGGLMAHVGCSDGQGIVAACKSGPFLAHGLDADPKQIEAARATLAQQKVESKGSVQVWKNDFLPYADDVVNLLILETNNVSQKEVMRVLTPKGKALVKIDGSWTTIDKPWPKEIDEWTHYLHGPDNNAVANDTRVAPPTSIRWIGGPKFARDHDAAASLSAMTSSNGRLFYIYDEGPISVIHQDAQWNLIARDAFNGVILWKRSIPNWLTHLYYFRAGPVWLNRMLVSVDDRVYSSLSFDQPIHAIDAATGKTLHTFAGSEKTEEIICIGDQLLAVIGDPAYFNRNAGQRKYYGDHFSPNAQGTPKFITAYDKSTGKLRWKVGGESLKLLVPASLAASGDRFVYLDGEKLHCCDLTTGKEIWSASFAAKKNFMNSYTTTVVIYEGNVLCMAYDKFRGFDLKTGKQKWEQPGAVGFASPADVFGVDNVVWTTPVTQGVAFGRTNTLGDGKILPALDLDSGKIVRSFNKRDVWTSGHHHRCYRNKATTNWLITGRSKTSFLDVKGKEHVRENYLRGECQYGLLPCNGLVYASPNHCRCFANTKLDGFHALSGSASEGEAPANRLEKGPAWGSSVVTSDSSSATSADWPTYRYDPQRSCVTTTDAPAKPSVKWKTQIGGKLTSCVAANEKIFVAATDRNSVYALDAGDGKIAWKHTARGPVDSPPTIWNGLAIFGSADGSVTALRADDGELVWRFFAAPTHRRIVAHGRLESAWPVHGGVLVSDGKVYFCAGRTSYLDNGIWFYSLDATTGKQVHVAHADARGNASDDGFSGQVQSDVMQLVGDAVMVRNLKLSKELKPGGSGAGGIVSPTGLLDGSWMHRIPAQINGAGWGNVKGKLLAVGTSSLWSAETPYTALKHTKSMQPNTHAGHLHQKYSRYTKDAFHPGTWLSCYTKASPGEARPAAGRRKGAIPKWRVTVPVQIRGLIASGDKVVTVGWNDEVNLKKFGDVKRPGAMLHVWDGKSGESLSSLELPSHPVYEGVISANRQLYVATEGGEILCLEGK